jgi:hypoxanthine phosphoribosyltransferase
LSKIPVTLVTWDDVVNWTSELAEVIKEDGYKVDVIVAVARGGMVPARLLADSLGILDVLSIKVEHWVETAAKNPEARVKYPYSVDLRNKSVLVVDDICDTGDSLLMATEHVRKNFGAEHVKTATMQYIETVSKYRPDYFSRTVREWSWFMYPWNYWEDEINLIRKLMNGRKLSDETKDLMNLEVEFRESYGISPPIPLNRIVKEMLRRGLA